MRRSILFVATLLVVVIGVTVVIVDDGLTGSTPTSGATPVGSPAPGGTPAPLATPISELVQVEIIEFDYDPSRVEIEVGTTVRWENVDFAPHTVTLDGVFDSGRLDHGSGFRHTFEEPGRFAYFCFYHQNMVGFVEVIDPQATKSASVELAWPTESKIGLT